MSSFELCLIAAAAAATSAGIVLALLPWLQRHALVHPNSRSSHRNAVPQGGGVAVIAATLGVVAAAMAIGMTGSPLNTNTLWLVFAATTFITIVGAADDIWTIEVAPRLLLQMVAVVVMIASLPAELRVVAWLPWWIERVVLLLAVMWFVNLTNFMDGIDWMTIAEFVPIAVGLAVIGYWGALPAHGVVVALALCGGLIGFAPFNRPVARIFLGDVGSLPIGLLFAWLLLLVAANGHLVAAIVLPLYYLADATVTLLRRMINRELFWQAHRTHFYQRATDRGLSVAEIVGRVFAVNLALVALAFGSVVWPGPLGAAIALGCGALLVGGLLWSFARGRS
jgi:UDP-N-acetylmuramyl pentapeptide phosphotransferase/UDP-N-acetylglucosamine-1-phosphate transferase